MLTWLVLSPLVACHRLLLYLSPPYSFYSGSTVYVGNLPWSVDEAMLNEHMSQAGAVVHAEVLRAGDGRSKGRGLPRCAYGSMVVFGLMAHTVAEVTRVCRQACVLSLFRPIRTLLQTLRLLLVKPLRIPLRQPNHSTSHRLCCCALCLACRRSPSHCHPARL